jgi:hypothetical protein
MEAWIAAAEKCCWNHPELQPIVTTVAFVCVFQHQKNLIHYFFLFFKQFQLAYRRLM